MSRKQGPNVVRARFFFLSKGIAHVVWNIILRVSQLPKKTHPIGLVVMQRIIAIHQIRIVHI